MTVRTQSEMEQILRDNPTITRSQVIRDLFDSLCAGTFTPTQPTDWTFEGDATIQAVLDEIGSRVTTAEGQLGSVAGLAYTPDQPTDWSPAPALLQDALDQLAARVKVLEP